MKFKNGRKSSSIPHGIDGDIQRMSSSAKSSHSVFGAFARALSLLQKVVPAVPLILYFLIKLGLIVTYYFSINEPLTSFWAHSIRGLSGQDLGHFPEHLLLMQRILGRSDIILDIFVRIIFEGASVLLISSYYMKKPTTLREGFSVAVKRYHHLLAAALLAGVGMALCLNLPSFLAGSVPRVLLLGVAVFSTFLGLIVQALFLYAIPYILIKNHTALRAIVNSVRMARKFSPQTFLLVSFPFVLTLPTVLLGLNAEMIALRLSPVFMIYNQVLGEIMQLVATYLIIGGATIFFVRRRKVV